MNTINNSQGNMSQPETNYRTTAGPTYSNITETQENTLQQILSVVLNLWTAISMWGV